MSYPSSDRHGGPVQVPTGPGVAAREYRSAPEMQAEMARLSAHGWHVAGITTCDERTGNAAATVLLFVVGWFVLFLTWPLMYWTWPRSSDVFMVTYTMGARRSWWEPEHGPPSSVARSGRLGRESLLRWRKATWANIIWNGFMAWLLVGSLQNTQIDERYGAFAYIATGVAVWTLLVIWFIGSIILALIWLASQPERDTAIYGPQGQRMIVTEEEARRWVDGDGWSYYPRPPYPAQHHQGQHAPQDGPPQPPPAGPVRP